ncbi:MAG TPA: hypothetical protein VI643_04250 [Planctomycetota bacterium]|nr:hypothetical protein [Planctomycetota bacterium]
MGGIGFGEILLVLVIAIVIWGGELPKVARKAANYYVRLRNQLMQVRDEVIRQIPDDITNLPPATDIPIYRDEPPGTIPVPPAPPAVPELPPPAAEPVSAPKKKARKRPSAKKKRKR